MQKVKNIVLVHGAWADGSSWSKLIPLLRASGFHAVAVQNPLSSIADDVASTNRLINAQDGPVLLVGHSYGGAVITEAGNNPKVVGMVYVAAFAPDEGGTLGGMAKNHPPTPAFSGIQPIEDGYLLLTETCVAENFAQDLTPEEKVMVHATQGATQAPYWRRRSRRRLGITSHPGSSFRPTMDHLARAGKKHGRAHEIENADAPDQPCADVVPAGQGCRLHHRGSAIRRPTRGCGGVSGNGR